MNPIFMRERDMLKEDILSLAGEVELRLNEVLKAAEQRDRESLLNWIDRDSEIDEDEVKIEEDCLKILALHQPVARDLRFVVAVLKINNDLERIGDIVVNIAEKGLRLSDAPSIDIFSWLIHMGKVAREMLKGSLDAFVTLDVAKAREVILRDDELDAMKKKVSETVVDRITAADTGTMTGALLLMTGVARDLERIGDHATNIAEDVSYLSEGMIVRHKRVTN
ncbi:MAG: phosphate signaling complex protein PhoU [Kiritimatiellae bacterium]|nr:phosphate signaling complex protein PhoU [Kiritimatiellia bacterium]